MRKILVNIQWGNTQPGRQGGVVGKICDY